MIQIDENEQVFVVIKRNEERIGPDIIFCNPKTANPSDQEYMNDPDYFVYPIKVGALFAHARVGLEI